MIKNIKDMAPNQTTIDMLKSLLAQAEAGEIRSILYCIQYEDCGVDYGWEIDPRGERRKFLGSLVLLQTDLAADILLATNGSAMSRQVFE